MIEDSYKPILLPGSENYWDAWELANKIELRFPDQDGYDFAHAMSVSNNNPLGSEGKTIEGLLLVQPGENDGAEWIWLVNVGGTHWWLTGWCDFTGWDCRGASVWSEYEPAV